MSIFDDFDETDVFRDRDVLKGSFVPDRLVEREDQINDFLSALMPAYKGEDPDHIFAFGPNGTGKTAATEYLLRELRESEENEAEINDLWINCNGVSTSYQLAIKITNKLLPPSEQIKRGKTQEEVFKGLFDELETVGGTVLIVLDELARVDDIENLMYEFVRASYTGGRLEDTQFGLVGLSASSKWYDRLSNDVKSSLEGKEIHFPAYDAPELGAILTDRVEQAFRDERVEDDVVPLAAAFAGQRSGDARLALEILRTAGDLARENGDGVVTEDHVRTAEGKVVRNHISRKIKSLSDDAKITLAAITALVANGNPEPRTSEIHSVYADYCDVVGISSVGQRSVREYLEDLEGHELTTKIKNGSGRGNWNNHRLEWQVGEVVPTIEDVFEKYATVYETIEALVDLESVDDVEVVRVNA